MPNENYRNPLRNAKKQTLRQKLASISPLQGLLSALFRTNQLFQELLFKLVLLKPTMNISKQNPFDIQKGFKNTSNQIKTKVPSN